MRNTQPVMVLTIALSLAGMAISYNLLVKHLEKTTGLAWFDSTCEAGNDEASRRSCDQVMASPWGTFPPVPKDVDARKRHEPVTVLGLFSMRPTPVALFGMLYFSVMAAWYLAIGRPSYPRRHWHLLPLILNSLGALSALFFSYIMFFTDMQAWCPWCMVAHVCNGLMLIGTIALWPGARAGKARHPAAAVAERAVRTSRVEPGTHAGTGSPQPAAGCSQGPRNDRRVRSHAPTRAFSDRHPAGRLLAVTLVGIAALSAAEWCHYEYASEAKAHAELQTAFAKLDHEMEQVRQHAKTLYSLFQRGEQKQIPLRDDAPLKNPSTDHLVAVVISDFRCPHCSRFAQYMKEVVEPMFGEELAITFKHFPADTTCNRRLRSTLHPKACLASTAVEAARLLGGTDAFWKAHDLLFASQDRLQDDAFYSEMARQLGLDQTQFAEALTSPTVLERINEDIELAVRIGVRGTPAVYVEGRLVPSLAREQDVFWEEIKRRFDRRKRSQPPTNTPE